MVLAIVTRQAAINSGRPVRLEQVAARLPSDITLEDLRAALARLVQKGAIYADGSGWQIRAVPVPLDATAAYASSTRLKS